jgi:pimeloyl-ACP methyl ester carboxylesterase
LPARDATSPPSARPRKNAYYPPVFVRFVSFVVDLPFNRQPLRDWVGYDEIYSAANLCQEAHVRVDVRPLAVWLFAITFSAQIGPLPPPPGRLIDVGGRRLHLHCTGTGTPTVIFAAGASSFAIDFSLVQPEVARTTRVCSYDRIGHGWSDPQGQNDPGTVADLHALLQAAGEKAPYVLAGASRGGLHVRQYEERYSDEVVGMVLIDPTQEDRLFTTLNGEAVAIASLTAEQLRSTFTPGPPVKIPRRAPQTGAPFDRLPAELYKTRIALDERLIASYPDSVPFEVVMQGAESERAQLAQLRQRRQERTHPLGDRPLVVLSRGLDTNPERDASFSQLAQISSNARHTVVKNAGHEIHLFEPTAVIQAVQHVVEAARNKTRLPRR